MSFLTNLPALFYYIIETNFFWKNSQNQIYLNYDYNSLTVPIM